MRIRRILRGGMFFICVVMLMAGFLSAEVSAAEENGFDGGGGEKSGRKFQSMEEELK